MKITRVLSAYHKVSEVLIEEIELPIELNALKRILRANADDPDLYDVYSINSEQFKSITELFPEAANLNFNEFDFFYECFVL